MKESHKKINFSDESGFTLLEVLIAITILSMLMVSIYSIIDNSTNTKDKILKEDREKMQFETGMARLEQDLVFIHSPLYFEASKKEDEVFLKKASGGSPQTTTSQEESYNQTYSDEGANPFEGHDHFDGLSESNRPIPKLVNEEKGSLVFMSSGGRRLLRDSKQSNLQWIRYSVVTNQAPQIKEAPYALTRTVIKEDLFKGQLDWDSAKEYIVIENLTAFEFNFWDPKREKYVESLREMTADKTTPRLIKVKLSYMNDNGETYDVVRTYRPLWPVVDTKKALEEKYKQTSQGGPSGSLKGGTQ